MKYLVKIFVIIFFLTCPKIVLSNDKIVYINMNKVLNNSAVGIFINKEIEKIHKLNLIELQKTQEYLKKEEEKILSQKNILSENEYINKINILKSNIENYKNDRANRIEQLKNKRTIARKKLLDNLNIILSEYSIENDLLYILNKENVVIAKKNLDITSNIIILLDKKVKKIKIN